MRINLRLTYGIITEKTSFHLPSVTPRKEWSKSLLLKTTLLAVCDLTSAPKIKGLEVRSAWLASIFILADVSRNHKQYTGVFHFALISKSAFAMESLLKNLEKTCYLFHLPGYLHQTKDHSLSSYLLLEMFRGTRFENSETRKISMSRLSSTSEHPRRKLFR